ncbi:hypothetical protein SAMN05720382_109126 [Polaromonas sp. JS666]|nr:hypothetical protein SAMN05720382_109126 [Polaromonas sp. JS666]
MPAILTAMIRKAALGIALLLAAAASYAGTAAGQFSVQITLTDPRNTTGNGNACISASGAGAGASSVQVRCNTDVFVSIAPVSNANALGNARFLPGFRPTRDSLLPDYCRSEISRGDQASRMACRLDDQRVATAGDEVDDGWEFESRRYAMGPEAAEIEKQARLRFQDVKGTLTTVRLAHAGNQPKSIEMLVSF